jgi:hypothetical protein
MNKRRTTAIILSLPVVIAIALWVFSARIVEQVVPPFLNRDALQISYLDIASIGFDRAEIRRLKGRALTDTGATTFDIKDAVVHYELPRFQPGRVQIGRARVEHRTAPTSNATPSDTAAVPLLSPVIVDQLHLTYDDVYEFNGSLAFTGSEKAFTVNAIDERSHLTVEGDASLSAFRLTLVGPDQKKIGSGNIVLDDSIPSSFALDAKLGPVLDWLRGMELVPADLAEQIKDIESISGELKLTGDAVKTGNWVFDIDLDVHRLATQLFNASGNLAGKFVPESHHWTFALTRDGQAQLTTVDELLTDVFSFNAVFPSGYSVSQETDGGSKQTVIGTGAAKVIFYRSGDLDLTAHLERWYLKDWKQLGFSLRDVVTTAPVDLSIDAVESDGTVGDSFAGKTSLSGIRTGEWPTGVPAADLTAGWEWSDGSLKGSGSASLGGPPEVEWMLNSRGARGQVRITLDTTVPELIGPFDKILEKNQYDLELTDGPARGVLKWTWDDDRYDNNLEFNASDVSGRFMGLEFRDVTFQMHSSDLVALTFKLNGAFPSITLANSVDVTNLSVAGRWQSGFYLDQAAFSVLGGKVKINPVFLDPDSPVISAELEISDIDLEQVMGMIDQSGLEGSGRLSGTIPLRLKESALAIDDGRLKNTTLGHLSYDAGDGAATQLNNIAVQALQDFRYDLLDATLNYQFEGAYSIRARIEGRNPTLYDGYPVAFNLNLSGSLPGLMQASLITGDFHSEILKQIQEQQ